MRQLLYLIRIINIKIFQWLFLTIFCKLSNLYNLGKGKGTGKETKAFSYGSEFAQEGISSTTLKVFIFL